MIIPIGGIFVFGTGGTRAGAMRNLIIGIFNVVFGSIGLLLGYLGNFFWGNVLVVFGYIIAGLGLLMIIFSIIALIKFKKNKNSQNHFQN